MLYINVHSHFSIYHRCHILTYSWLLHKKVGTNMIKMSHYCQMWLSLIFQSCPLDNEMWHYWNISHVVKHNMLDKNIIGASTWGFRYQDPWILRPNLGLNTVILSVPRLSATWTTQFLSLEIRVFIDITVNNSRMPGLTLGTKNLGTKRSQDP